MDPRAAHLPTLLSIQLRKLEAKNYPKEFSTSLLAFDSHLMGMLQKP